MATRLYNSLLSFLTNLTTPPDQPLRICTTAMLSLTASLLAALKSLARLRSYFSFFYSRLLATRSLSRSARPQKTLEDLHAEISELFGFGIGKVRLKALSEGLRKQYKHALKGNPHCMLPSFNDVLPSGAEKGTYLALDVGGSTFRVAVLELLGDGKEDFRVVRTWKIDDAIKALEGEGFFDWVAARIGDTLDEAGKFGNESFGAGGESPVLQMGLAWSFPIEHTSLRGGRIHGMGKGFRAAEALLGRDLNDVLQQACERRHLKVHLLAIVNDGASTLLSSAYHHPTTRYGLILGTGVNMAVHLPVSHIGLGKFGARPQTWIQGAKHVIVNTEVSMFGKDILPTTRWDMALNAAHAQRDFQPLELMVGGRYLGEIARLAILEAVESARLFGGEVPEGLEAPYSLPTEILSQMQAEANIGSLLDAHPLLSNPTDADAAFLIHLATCISTRAAAVLAAATHALAAMRNDEGGNALEHELETEIEKEAVVACAGAVIQSYFGFRETCQGFLDGLVEGEDEVEAESEAEIERARNGVDAVVINGDAVSAKVGYLNGNGNALNGSSVKKGGKMGKVRTGRLVLVLTKESSLVGAAVAVACAQGRAVER